MERFLICLAFNDLMHGEVALTYRYRNVKPRGSRSRGVLGHKLLLYHLHFIRTSAVLRFAQGRSIGNEAEVQAAILAYQANEFKSIRAAALVFSVPPSTVQDRLAG